MIAEHYNYFRDYDPSIGRYIESDPVGLYGGKNTYAYVDAAPLNYVDYAGLFSSSVHNEITGDAVGMTGVACPNLPADVALVDYLPHSQDTDNAHWHAMRDGKNPGATADSARRDFEAYVQQSWKLCTCQGLARALHAVQDSHAAGHAGFQPWSGGILGTGLPDRSHMTHDGFPSKGERGGALDDSVSIIRQYQSKCKKSCLAN